MEVLVREIERDEEEQEGETEEEKERGEGEGGNKTEKRKVAGMAAVTVTVTVTVASLLLTRMDVRKNPQKCWKGMIESHQSFVNVQSDGGRNRKRRKRKVERGEKW
ncbi:hypothetical protein HZH68_012695 [Vespula germanica]|uniref:Transmembrane protein n=1 Tax=Vespula germanica TaxID=30212 RepID=A0A834JHE8_VESGE|nr:hypothetical protein HZH68_012695 [Vespula germanica]